MSGYIARPSAQLSTLESESPSGDSSAHEDFELMHASSSSSLQGGVSRRPKRANHNELERKRRLNQKGQLYDLRDLIPHLSMDKPSAVVIIQRAKEYIQELQRQASEQSKVIAALQQQLLQANPRFKMPLPDGNPFPVGPPHSVPPTAVAMTVMRAQASEIDRLRKDNEDLMDRFEGIENDTVQNNINVNARTGNNHPQNTNTGANSSVSRKRAPKITNKPEDMPSVTAGPVSDPTFLKRKSVADFDFDHARRQFYDRRDSQLALIETMTQQLIAIQNSNDKLLPMTSSPNDMNPPGTISIDPSKYMMYPPMMNPNMLNSQVRKDSLPSSYLGLPPQYAGFFMDDRNYF